MRYELFIVCKRTWWQCHWYCPSLHVPHRIPSFPYKRLFSNGCPVTWLQFSCTARYVGELYTLHSDGGSVAAWPGWSSPQVFCALRWNLVDICNGVEVAGFFFHYCVTPLASSAWTWPSSGLPFDKAAQCTTECGCYAVAQFYGVHVDMGGRGEMGISQWSKLCTRWGKK